MLTKLPERNEAARALSFARALSRSLPKIQTQTQTHTHTHITSASSRAKSSCAPLTDFACSVCVFGTLAGGVGVAVCVVWVWVRERDEREREERERERGETERQRERVHAPPLVLFFPHTKSSGKRREREETDQYILYDTHGHGVTPRQRPFYSRQRPCCFRCQTETELISLHCLSEAALCCYIYIYIYHIIQYGILGWILFGGECVCVCVYQHKICIYLLVLLFVWVANPFKLYSS